MVDPKQVIDESRPMLEEFLAKLGIYKAGQPMADEVLRDAFSDWIASHDIRRDEYYYLVAYVGSYIGEYLIEARAAEYRVDGQRIMIRVPVDASQGGYREFEPYAVAAGIVSEGKSLKESLALLCE